MVRQQPCDGIIHQYEGCSTCQSMREARNFSAARQASRFLPTSSVLRVMKIAPTLRIRPVRGMKLAPMRAAAIRRLPASVCPSTELSKLQKMRINGELLSEEHADILHRSRAFGSCGGVSTADNDCTTCCFVPCLGHPERLPVSDLIASAPALSPSQRQDLQDHLVGVHLTPDLIQKMLQNLTWAKDPWRPSHEGSLLKKGGLKLKEGSSASGQKGRSIDGTPTKWILSSHAPGSPGDRVLALHEGVQEVRSACSRGGRQARRLGLAMGLLQGQDSPWLTPEEVWAQLLEPRDPVLAPSVVQGDPNVGGTGRGVSNQRWQSARDAPQAIFHTLRQKVQGLVGPAGNAAEVLQRGMASLGGAMVKYRYNSRAPRAREDGKAEMPNLWAAAKGKGGNVRAATTSSPDGTGRNTVMACETLAPDEVLLPLMSANELTQLVAITPANVERERKNLLSLMVRSAGDRARPFAHWMPPGAFGPGNPSEMHSRCLSNHLAKAAEAMQMVESLRPGGLLSRSLVDGDLVLMWRCPAMKETNLTVMRVIVGRDPTVDTLFYSPFITTLFAGDFDGDEHGLMVLPLEVSRLEALLQATPASMVMGRRGGELTMRPRHDGYTGQPRLAGLLAAAAGSLEALRAAIVPALACTPGPCGPASLREALLAGDLLNLPQDKDDERALQVGVQAGVARLVGTRAGMQAGACRNAAAAGLVQAEGLGLCAQDVAPNTAKVFSSAAWRTAVKELLIQLLASPAAGEKHECTSLARRLVAALLLRPAGARPGSPQELRVREALYDAVAGDMGAAGSRERSEWARGVAEAVAEAAPQGALASAPPGVWLPAALSPVKAVLCYMAAKYCRHYRDEDVRPLWEEASSVLSAVQELVAQAHLAAGTSYSVLLGHKSVRSTLVELLVGFGPQGKWGRLTAPMAEGRNGPYVDPEWAQQMGSLAALGVLGPLVTSLRLGELGHAAGQVWMDTALRKNAVSDPGKMTKVAVATMEGLQTLVGGHVSDRAAPGNWWSDPDVVSVPVPVAPEPGQQPTPELAMLSQLSLALLGVGSGPRSPPQPVARLLPAHLAGGNLWRLPLPLAAQVLSRQRPFARGGGMWVELQMPAGSFEPILRRMSGRGGRPFLWAADAAPVLSQFALKAQRLALGPDAQSAPDTQETAAERARWAAPLVVGAAARLAALTAATEGYVPTREGVVAALQDLLMQVSDRSGGAIVVTSVLSCSSESCVSCHLPLEAEGPPALAGAAGRVQATLAQLLELQPPSQGLLQPLWELPLPQAALKVFTSIPAGQGGTGRKLLSKTPLHIPALKELLRAGKAAPGVAPSGEQGAAEAMGIFSRALLLGRVGACVPGSEAAAAEQIVPMVLVWCLGVMCTPEASRASRDALLAATKVAAGLCVNSWMRSGDCIGLAAAAAIGEPLVQAAMSKKKRAGAKGAGIGAQDLRGVLMAKLPNAHIKALVTWPPTRPVTVFEAAHGAQCALCGEPFALRTGQRVALLPPCTKEECTLCGPGAPPAHLGCVCSRLSGGACGWAGAAEEELRSEVSAQLEAATVSRLMRDAARITPLALDGSPSLGALVQTQQEGPVKKGLQDWVARMHKVMGYPNAKNKNPGVDHPLEHHVGIMHVDTGLFMVLFDKELRKPCNLSNCRMLLSHLGRQLVGTGPLSELSLAPAPSRPSWLPDTAHAWSLTALEDLRIGPRRASPHPTGQPRLGGAQALLALPRTLGVLDYTVATEDPNETLALLGTRAARTALLRALQLCLTDSATNEATINPMYLQLYADFAYARAPDAGRIPTSWKRRAPVFINVGFGREANAGSFQELLQDAMGPIWKNLTCAPRTLSARDCVASTILATPYGAGGPLSTPVVAFMP